MRERADRLQRRQRSAAVAAQCGNCQYFCDGAAELDRQFPLLRTLGSVYGSVRGSDGLCQQHWRYVMASGQCESHAPRPQEARVTPPGY